MPRSADVELTVDTLFQMGVLSEEGCARFAEFVRGLQALPALRGGGNGGQARRKPTGRKFDPSEAELRGWYLSQGMTVKEIADAHGISTPTVNDRLKKYGIRKRGPGGAIKKKRSKKVATRKKRTKKTKKKG